MNATPPNPDSETGHIAPKIGRNPWYICLCILVVATGMFFGVIVAFFVGLFAGWIDLRC